ncbi:MAG TPA: glycosyl transferase [Chloroflexi bacterium]|nr:glycosyl transferase [Chloroflexota bacterium]
MADHQTSRIRLRPSEHRVLLFIGDLLMSVASDFAAIYTWKEYQRYVLMADDLKPKVVEQLLGNIEIPFWFYLLPFVWLLLMIELYEPHTATNWRKTLRGIAIAAFVGLVIYSLVFIIRVNPNALPRIGVGAFLLYASILTLLWRSLYIRFNTSSGQLRRILVVGAGKAGHTLAEVFLSQTPPPFNLIGYIDDDPQKLGQSIFDFPVISQSFELLEIIESYKISDIVVAISSAIQGATFQTILDAQEQGVEVTRMPTLYEEMTGRVPIHHLESDWVIRSFVDEARVSGMYLLAKRLIDVLGGLAGLVIFVIIFPLTALATLIDSGLPIFYSQIRSGKGGQLFKIYKFRTMRQDAEADGQARLAEENDPRVTVVGNFLRRTRLDEFPQFWNVLRGEISLVGPRAERPELVDSFQEQIPFYRARLLVKPGVTGWAQINYGYVSTVGDTAVKLEYDLYYIKHRTLGMDLNIILRTIGTMLSGKGR